MRYATHLCFVALLVFWEAPASAQPGPVTLLTPQAPASFSAYSGSGVALAEADDGTWAFVGSLCGDFLEVWHHTPDGWARHTRLVHPEGQDDVRGFGSPLAAAGRFLLVSEGGCFDDAERTLNRAYVYRRDGDGLASAWTLEAVLVPGDLPEGLAFGLREPGLALDTSAEALAAGGLVAVVGAVPADTTGVLERVPGAAFVFRRSAAGTWVEEAMLRPSAGLEVRDEFGFAVSASKGRLLIGSYGEGDDSGRARVYVFDDEEWVVEDVFSVEGGVTLGGSVALDGPRALVGAAGDYCPPFFGQPGCGSAHVFERVEGGVWEHRRRLALPDPDFDGFGVSVALAGDRAVVTAPNYDAQGRNKAGAGFLFIRDEGSGEWVLTEELGAPTPRQLDRIGYGAALLGPHALVGGPLVPNVAYAWDLDVLLPSAPRPHSSGTMPRLAVYPNPVGVSGTVTAEVAGGGGPATLEVVDLLGRVVRRVSFLVGASAFQRVELDTRGLTAGRYFIRVSGARGPLGDESFTVL